MCGHRFRLSFRLADVSPDQVVINLEVLGLVGDLELLPQLVSRKIPLPYQTAECLLQERRAIALDIIDVDSDLFVLLQSRAQNFIAKLAPTERPIAFVPAKGCIRIISCD